MNVREELLQILIDHPEIFGAVEDRARNLLETQYCHQSMNQISV